VPATRNKETLVRHDTATPDSHQGKAECQDIGAMSSKESRWIHFAQIRRLRDEFRRTSKRLPQLRQADILFVSHAKSGRPSIRVMISHVFHRLYRTPIDELLEFDNIHKIDCRALKIIFTELHNESMIVCVILAQLAPRKRLRLLVREPRDVTVSYYFNCAKRSTARARAWRGLPNNLALVGVEKFMLDQRCGLASIIAFMNRWAAIAACHPAVLLQRYEDFRAVPEKHLTETIRFLGCEASAAAVEASVEFASLAALKERERRHFFASERLRRRDAVDPASFKVRRGKVGGYRDYLSAKCIEKADRLAAGTFSPTLDYPVRARSPWSDA